MGNKQLKNRVPVGSAVDKDLYNKLLEYKEQTGTPLSKLLDKAIDLFLKSTEKQ